MWANPKGFRKMTLPERDKSLIFSFHHYAPLAFTHQGAKWIKKKRPVGVEWHGSAEEEKELRINFKKAEVFSRKFDVPIYVGELGSYKKADQPSRIRWTRAVVDVCNEYGFSYAYWEFKIFKSFGVYDEKTQTWDEDVVNALIPSGKK
jgi:endoglucanase